MTGWNVEIPFGSLSGCVDIAFVWRRNAEDCTSVDAASSAASATRKLLKISCLGHSWVVQRYVDTHVQMHPKLWEIKPTFPIKAGLGARVCVSQLYAGECMDDGNMVSDISDTTRILSVFGCMTGGLKICIMRRLFITCQSGSTQIRSTEIHCHSVTALLFSHGFLGGKSNLLKSLGAPEGVTRYVP